MVLIPPGSFTMGGVPEDKFVSAVELPVREVRVLGGFEISRTPVTRAQWECVMGSLQGGNSAVLDAECPVVGVSFEDAKAFCREIGEDYRLPSEAEWEYACRGGNSSVFPHGSNVSVNDANYFYDEFGEEVGRGELMPVGRFPENGFGLQDIIGNVCEWVEDIWHPGFDRAPDTTVAWVNGGVKGRRVIRGGGWDHLPRVLRASWRDWAPEEARWDNLGFRVVRDLTTT
ncbi:MAG: formylglycine-generating enzyme family protein [Luteolibacter sp.]